MKSSLATLCLLLATAFRATAVEKWLVAETPLTLSVTTNHYIPCGLTGTVAVAFTDACALLMQPDLLDLVQAEYARQLPAGSEPEFVVEAAGTNRWSYVNRKGEYSELHEVACQLTPSGQQLDVVFYARGKRFFGWFRAAMAIRLCAGPADQCTYQVKVFAYPESAFPRFFARHLGLVESFFRDKTDELTALTVRVSQGLLSRRAAGDMGRTDHSALAETAGP